MFTQIDTALERSLTGLGIGLTLVKKLTEMHGGTVEVHSAGIGQGSEFVVRLPLAVDTDTATATPPPSQSVVITPLRILIVDDRSSWGASRPSTLGPRREAPETGTVRRSQPTMALNATAT